MGPPAPAPDEPTIEVTRAPTTAAGGDLPTVRERLEDFWLADDVFVCYTHRDASTYALRLLAELRKAGLRVHLDVEAYTAGESLSALTVRHIARAQLLLVVLSPRSTDSEWMPKEIIEAIRNNITIVPLVWPGCEQHGESLGLSQGLVHVADPKAPDAVDAEVPRQVVASLSKLRRGRRRVAVAAVVAAVVGTLLTALASSLFYGARAESDRGLLVDASEAVASGDGPRAWGALRSVSGRTLEWVALANQALAVPNVSWGRPGEVAVAATPAHLVTMDPKGCLLLFTVPEMALIGQLDGAVPPKARLVWPEARNIGLNRSACIILKPGTPGGPDEGAVPKVLLSSEDQRRPVALTGTSVAWICGDRRICARSFAANQVVYFNFEAFAPAFVAWTPDDTIVAADAKEVWEIDPTSSEINMRGSRWQSSHSRSATAESTSLACAEAEGRAVTLWTGSAQPGSLRNSLVSWLHAHPESRNSVLNVSWQKCGYGDDSKLYWASGPSLDMVEGASLGFGADSLKQEIRLRDGHRQIVTVSGTAPAPVQVKNDGWKVDGLRAVRDGEGGDPRVTLLRTVNDRSVTQTNTDFGVYDDGSIALRVPGAGEAAVTLVADMVIANGAHGAMGWSLPLPHLELESNAPLPAEYEGEYLSKLPLDRLKNGGGCGGPFLWAGGNLAADGEWMIGALGYAAREGFAIGVATSGNALACEPLDGLPAYAVRADGQAVLVTEPRSGRVQLVDAKGLHELSLQGATPEQLAWLDQSSVVGSVGGSVVRYTIESDQLMMIELPKSLPDEVLQISTSPGVSPMIAVRTAKQRTYLWVEGEWIVGPGAVNRVWWEGTEVVFDSTDGQYRWQFDRDALSKDLGRRVVGAAL